MLPDPVKDWYVNLVGPVTRFLVKHRIHPNLLSIVGFVISALGAVFIFGNSLVTGGVLILIGGTFDIFDGSVARATGRNSPFGAFFDSTLDRFSEIIIYLSLLYWFVTRGDMVTGYVILVAMGGALMVSYTRARAEALGFTCLVGFLQRPERVVFIGFGAFFDKVGLIIAIYIVAVLSVFTALQRVFHVYSLSRHNPPEQS